MGRLMLRHLKLGAFLYPTGYHVAAWRHPDVPAGSGTEFGFYAGLAHAAEEAGFDFLFLPDSQAIRGDDMAALSRTAIRYVAQFEPLTLLSGLAAITSRIGLIASISTTYFHPYHVARMMSSLDHLSHGRAGWNLVTSQNKYEAFNFGENPHPSHAERYDRAEEFVDVVRGLWDSWSEDAFVCDKKTGIFFDPGGVRQLKHYGRHFAVRGPLNLPRSPQGHPVICQAGSSTAGRRLAARTADVVFTAQDNLGDAKAFYADVKASAASMGRREGTPLILAGVCPYIGVTRAEAQSKLDQLHDLVHPDAGISLLEGQLGEVDLSGHPVDGPLPPIPETDAGRSRRDLLVATSRREGLTIRHLYLRTASGRGHLEVIGTPVEVADTMEEWFSEGAADGFNIMAPILPGGFTDFTELVVPELSRRGLLGAGEAAPMLRERLGLAPAPPRR
jgi:FMN-dependent oxidoreductase (nitrilotriacetate monooxygenase family)